MIDAMRQDVKGAVRGLSKSPGFAVAALVTLALGIGATSAIFSVVKAVLLTPLPYAEPDRRVLIWSRWISFDKTWLSDQEIVDYRNFSKTMTAVAGWSTGQQNLTGDGEPVRVGVGFVTANTFDVLGAQPLLGRTFTAAEDRPERAAGRRSSAIRCGRRATAAIRRCSGGSCCSTTCRSKSSASCRRASGCRPTSPPTRRSRRSCGGRCRST